MVSPTLDSQSLPELYQRSDQISLRAQSQYFLRLRLYLGLLVLAALTAFIWPHSRYGAIATILLFSITLGILVSLRVNRFEDLWYNGRAVAESVKTRAWRWAMRADPYGDDTDTDIVSRFTADLNVILNHNRSLSQVLEPTVGSQEPVSDVMWQIRRLPVVERLDIYKTQRVDNQAEWYARKAQVNQVLARRWFWVSILLHTAAAALLLYRVVNPALNLPIGTIAAAAGAVIAWTPAKRYSELISSYSLTALEIGVIQDNAALVKTEQDLSRFVLSSEAAFSREHTQWVARKAE